MRGTEKFWTFIFVFEERSSTTLGDMGPYGENARCWDINILALTLVCCGLVRLVFRSNCQSRVQAISVLTRIKARVVARRSSCPQERAADLMFCCSSEVGNSSLRSRSRSRRWGWTVAESQTCLFNKEEAWST